MNLIESIVLGFVQGAAEFLPISSSGHLVIVQYLFGIEENNLAFSILLHLATFFAIVIAYHETVLNLIKEFFLTIKDIFTGKGFNLKSSKYRYYILYVIIATIPAGVAGVLLDDIFEEIFSNIYVVCFTLFFTGIILYVAEKLSKKANGTIEEMGPLKAVVVGLFQAFAIMPGISRSGTTMTGGLACGLKKEDALELSFLLALPTILGSVVLKISDIGEAIAQISIPVCAAGFVTAFVVGLLSIWLFKKIVKSGSMLVFSVYCWLVSLSLIVLL